MSRTDTFRTLCSTRAGDKRSQDPANKNQDRVLVRHFTTAETLRDHPALLVAVADGVSRCADGGGVAEWLIHEHLERDRIFESAVEPLGRQLASYLSRIHRQFIGEFAGQVDMMQSGCTFSAFLLSGNRATAFWAGDSPLHYLRRNGEKLSVRTVIIPDKDPMSGALTDCFSGVTPFAIKLAGTEVRAGDILIAVSDGVLFDGMDLAVSLQKMGFNEEWMEDVMNRSYVRGCDDITLAAVEVGEEAS